MGKRRLREQADAWESIADHWQQLATWRGEALDRVWLTINTIQDESVCNQLREAMVGEFILSSFERGTEVDDDAD